MQVADGGSGECGLAGTLGHWEGTTPGNKGNTRRYKSAGDATKQEGEVGHVGRRRAGAMDRLGRVYDVAQTVLSNKQATKIHRTVDGKTERAIL